MKKFVDWLEQADEGELILLFLDSREIVDRKKMYTLVHRFDNRWRWASRPFHF